MQRDPGQSPGALRRIGVTEHGQVTCRRHRLTSRARRCFRVEPNERNGLRAACRLMVDTTVPKTKAGTRVGRLDDEDILRLNQAVLVFLGLAVSPRTKQRA
jgi:mRNA-degrading endonuclease toxin of MazEF toxin-antitoxin module